LKRLEINEEKEEEKDRREARLFNPTLWPDSGTRVHSSTPKTQIPELSFQRRAQSRNPAEISDFQILGLPLESRILVECLGSGIQSFGFGVWGLGFRVQGSGFRVQGSEFRIRG